MPLRLYNTLARTVQPFAPLEADRVGMYVCGLTPSAEGHLGHARSFLFFDVQNVTDIDDRSIATAQREGTTYDRVVTRFYDAFKTSMQRLGVREPDVEPYAARTT